MERPALFVCTRLLRGPAQQSHMISAQASACTPAEPLHPTVQQLDWNTHLLLPAANKELAGECRPSPSSVARSCRPGAEGWLVQQACGPSCMALEGRTASIAARADQAVLISCYPWWRAGRPWHLQYVARQATPLGSSLSVEEGEEGARACDCPL